MVDIPAPWIIWAAYGGVKQKVPDHDIQTVTPCWDTTVVPSGKHSQFAIEHGPVEIVDLAS